MTMSASATQELRDVMVVGNNRDGTASIVDARSFEVLGKDIDLVPDKEDEIARDPPGSRTAGDVLPGPLRPRRRQRPARDDMFTTRDGKLLAVSRPSLADVVWIDIEKALAGSPDSVVVEQEMDGHRTDHMDLSPDGTKQLVSDSTSRSVHEYWMGGAGDPRSGERPRLPARRPEGDLPRLAAADQPRPARPRHHPRHRPAPADQDRPDPIHDAIQGDRWFEIVDESTFDVSQRWEMGKELEEAGYPSISSAVRPMAVAPGERFIYFQMSFLHGIVEFDTQAADIDGKVGYSTGSVEEPRTGAVTRVIQLPKRTQLPRELYVNDSAHHGLSIDSKGETVCAAGTMDDCVAMVDRSSGEHHPRRGDHRPLLRQALLDHRRPRQHLLGRHGPTPTRSP